MLGGEGEDGRSYDWQSIARPSQILPAGDWLTWLILAGRGWGKTRVGAETMRQWAQVSRYHILAGPTAADIRDVMIEGESGILAICPDGERPRYEPSKARLSWPNGAVSLLMSADEPERFRGKQCEKAWLDELASWRYPAAFDQLQLGNRLGDNPQIIVTTTPKPTKLIRELLARESTHVTRGSTYENKENLAGAFIDQIIQKYEGTRLGRQELHAEVLDDVEGALWTLDMIEAARVCEMPELSRIVVGVDPNASNNDSSDEMGIITAGIATVNGVTHGYVIDDPTMKGTPKQRGEAVVAAYSRAHADCIVPEVNNGGDMVEYLIQSVATGIKPRIIPVHAARGKLTRAEPVAALYEQGRIHHVGGFAKLEDELTSWVPGGESPNRLDALVHAFTELFGLKETIKPSTKLVTPHRSVGNALRRF